MVVDLSFLTATSLPSVWVEIRHVLDVIVVLRTVELRRPSCGWRGGSLVEIGGVTGDSRWLAVGDTAELGILQSC